MGRNTVERSIENIVTVHFNGAKRTSWSEPILFWSLRVTPHRAALMLLGRRDVTGHGRAQRSQ